MFTGSWQWVAGTIINLINLAAKSPCFYKSGNWEESHHIWRNSLSSLCFIKIWNSGDVTAFATLFIITPTYFFSSHHFMSLTTSQFLIYCRIQPSFLGCECVLWSHVILSLSTTYHSCSTLYLLYTTAVILYFADRIL